MLHLLTNIVLGYQPDVAGAVYAAGQAVASWVSQAVSVIHNAPCPADWFC
jgi:hypothetical protein